MARGEATGQDFQARNEPQIRRIFGEFGMIPLLDHLDLIGKPQEVADFFWEKTQAKFRTFFKYRPDHPKKAR